MHTTARPWTLLFGTSVIALALMIPACADQRATGRLGPGETGETDETDVVTLLATTQAWSPDLMIDLGAPTSRRYMLDGWSAQTRPVQAEDGSGSGVGSWSLGEKATLELLSIKGRDLPVRFRCAPAGPVEHRPASLEMLVNGSRWRSFELASQMKVYQGTIPGRLLRDGAGTLTIVHHGGDQAAAGVAASTPRVLWDVITFGAPTGSGSTPQVDGRSLRLVQGTGIDLFTELPAYTELRLDGVHPQGARIRITWTPENEQVPAASEVLSGGSAEAVQLTEEARAGGVLTLVALPAEPQAAAGARQTTISAPRLAYPRGAGQPDTTALQSAGSPVSDEPAAAQPPERPDLVIYLIDTLRADHIGCYGYPRPTTPNIDRFAAQAALFENAQAQSPWTRSSVASIMTGLHPQTHGAVGREDKLSESARTLAERLHDCGYYTVGVVANGNAHRPFGFAQGFDEFVYLPNLATSDKVHVKIVKALKRRPADRPLFLWIHTIDPHAPYDPPEPFRSHLAPGQPDPEAGSIERIGELRRQGQAVSEADVRRMIDLYDGEIAANDASFGRLVKELTARGLFDGAMIMLLSDHGEEFMDHGGWAHGKTLHGEMLNVPLIIKPPHWSSGQLRVQALAQHIDIAPSALEYGSCPDLSAIQGRSLRPILDTGAAPDGWPRISIAHLDLDQRRASSIAEGRYKVIMPRWEDSPGSPQLFDRVTDPAERDDLALDKRALARRLTAKLAATEAALSTSQAADRLDLSAAPEVEKQLRALGYIE